MARALYREWFVEFRFPGHENVAVPSSGGAPPAGWDFKLVGSILERQPAGTVYREADARQVGSIPIVGQSSDEVLGFHDESADHRASPQSPIAIFGDHTCKMQLLVESFSVGPNVIPFRGAGGLPTAYVFFAVRDLVHSQEYKRHWTPLINRTVLVADPALAHRFASCVAPMLETQELLKKVIRNLTSTRNLLLPRLLSGSFRFKDTAA